MELNELQAFVKIVQTGSFTKAAEAMNTQKAYLSRLVTNLETKLGIRLLERSTRSLSLTQSGYEIFEKALEILKAVDETKKIADQNLSEPRGVLKLTCGVEFGMLAVSGWINGYLSLYPKVSIEADFSGRLTNIIDEGFDLAIRIGDLKDSNLVSRRLGMLQYGFFASPAYLQMHGIPKTADDLIEHDQLVFGHNSSLSKWKYSGSSRNARAFEETVRLRVNNSFAARDAALLGLGICQLPWLIAKEPVNTGKLTEILPECSIPEVPINAIYPSQKYLTPKVRTFIDYALNNFES